jgi:AraC family transcriptional regulator
MTRRRTAESYARRLQRVTAYIAANLDAPLTLAELASVAHFSEFHFHRIYRELMGETVADSVRRLRLHRAAAELVNGDTPLARVAMRAGYGSTAAFSRAFAAEYGAAPGAYRRSRTPHRSTALVPEPEALMNDVQFHDFPALRLAGLRHCGPYLEIGGAFERLTAWAAPRRLIGRGTRYFAIYYDDPESVPTAALRSDACMTIPADVVVEGEARLIEQPPLRCAVLRHKGPYAELEQAYRWLYRVWLPQSGHEPADAPPFEEYVNDPRTMPPPEWLTDICVPLRLA